MINETALFIGRFQPLHKGHLHALKNALNKYKKVIILVGSTNKKGERNPFSLSKRREMLEKALCSYNNYSIIGIPDRKTDEEWKMLFYKYDFDTVISGEDNIRFCFSDKNVERIKMFKRHIYCSTAIRNLIKEGKAWKYLVPKEVVGIVEKHYEKTKNIAR